MAELLGADVPGAASGRGGGRSLLHRLQRPCGGFHSVPQGHDGSHESSISVDVYRQAAKEVGNAAGQVADRVAQCRSRGSGSSVRSCIGITPLALACSRLAPRV